MIKRVGLFLGAAPHYGGAFQYNQSMLDALARLPSDEFEPFIGYSHPSWPQYLERYRFKQTPIPLGYWGRVFGQLLHYCGIGMGVWRRLAPYFHPSVRAFVRAECDIWIFPSQDPWCYLAPVPSLATIHDLMHRYERQFPEVGNRKEYSWREWHYRNTCSWSKGILVDSEIGKSQVIDSYGVDASQVHLLPFIAPSYLDDVSKGDAGHSDCSLPNKFLFYPAQFWEHKNHLRLIEAVGRLKRRFPEIRLLLVGSKKNGYEAARRKVEQLGLREEVIFLGYVSDAAMNDLYRRARAMIMPSFFGPTNIPPLEAMRVGCPAAIANVYGMPEQTKGAALLFDPASVDDMTSAMARLWEDDELCRMLAARGKEVSGNWTLEHFSKHLAEVLRSLLSPGSRVAP